MDAFRCTMPASTSDNAAFIPQMPVDSDFELSTLHTCSPHTSSNAEQSFTSTAGPAARERLVRGSRPPPRPVPEVDNTFVPFYGTFDNSWANVDPNDMSGPVFGLYPGLDVGQNVDAVPAEGITDNVGLLPIDNAELLSAVNPGLLPDANSGSLPIDNADLFSADNSGLLLGANSGLLPDDYMGSLPLVNLGLTPTDNLGSFPIDNSELLSDANSGLLPAANSGSHPTDNLGPMPADNSGSFPFDFSTVAPALDSGFEPNYSLASSFGQESYANLGPTPPYPSALPPAPIPGQWTAFPAAVPYPYTPAPFPGPSNFFPLGHNFAATATTTILPAPSSAPSAPWYAGRITSRDDLVASMGRHPFAGRPSVPVPTRHQKAMRAITELVAPFPIAAPDGNRSVKEWCDQHGIDHKLPHSVRGLRRIREILEERYGVRADTTVANAADAEKPPAARQRRRQAVRASARAHAAAAAAAAAAPPATPAAEVGNFMLASLPQEEPSSSSAEEPSTSLAEEPSTSSAEVSGPEVAEVSSPEVVEVSSPEVVEVSSRPVEEVDNPAPGPARRRWPLTPPWDLPEDEKMVWVVAVKGLYGLE